MCRRSPMRDKPPAARLIGRLPKSAWLDSVVAV
jgi:hypothetical protein